MNGHTNSPDYLCTKISESIRASTRILFITGAGISADSGIPTYRGIGGLYERRDTDEGVPIEYALSSHAFQTTPALTWKYLLQIGRACRTACPNRAHEIIARIQSYKPHTWVLTQNIDGLHRRAGTRNLIEIHGHAFDLFCTKCATAVPADELFTDMERTEQLPPRCRKQGCGGIIRPDVVLFNEQLPQKALAQLHEVLENVPECVISIGTTSCFPYISAAMYIPTATTTEINPSATDVSVVATYRLPLRAADAMERIWKLLRFETE